MGKQTLTICISKEAWLKLRKTKADNGTPFNFQIEQAILRGD